MFAAFPSVPNCCRMRSRRVAHAYHRGFLRTFRSRIRDSLFGFWGAELPERPAVIASRQSVSMLTLRTPGVNATAISSTARPPVCGISRPNALNNVLQRLLHRGTSRASPMGKLAAVDEVSSTTFLARIPPSGCARIFGLGAVRWSHRESPAHRLGGVVRNRRLFRIGQI